jgi:plastin-1
MYLNLQSRTSTKKGGSRNSSSFLNAATTTLLHTISESEKKAYVAHINSCFEDDPIMKRYLPIDPSTNDLFEIAKDGVLLWYTFLATKVLSYNNNGHRVWI